MVNLTLTFRRIRTGFLLIVFNIIPYIDSRKSVRWSAVPVAPVSVWMCDGERGSGPEGADDLCLVILEALCWDLSLEAAI